MFGGTCEVPPIRTLLLTVAVAVVLAPNARAAGVGFFKTPTGNIVCSHSPDGVTCGIKSRLRPPPKGHDCHGAGDWQTDRIGVGKKGRGYAGMCAGDIGPFAGLTFGHARVLGYGKSLTDGDFRCRSEVKGVTCKYRGNHGFFVSRERYRTY